MLPAETMPPPIDVGDIFVAGFTDGSNPCALAVIVWLVVFLAVAGDIPQRYLSLGKHFIAAYFVTGTLFTAGLVDLLAALFNSHILLRNLQLLVGVAAIGAAGVLVADWWRYSSADSSRPLVKYPAILFSSSTGVRNAASASFWKLPVLGGWGVGVLAAALASVWPSSYVVTQLQAGMYIPSEWLTSFLTIVLYQVLFCLPLLAAFALILFAVHTEKFILACRNSIGVVKMALAGMLLGLGVGLIYLFRY